MLASGWLPSVDDPSGDGTSGDGSDADQPESDPGVVDRSNMVTYGSYDEWSTHALAPLVPSPQDLGPGWDNFDLQLLEEAALFDPASEEPGMDCGLSEPLVLRDGFYVEHGYDGDVDDTAVLLSRGTSDQMAAFFDGFRSLLECPAQAETLGTVIEMKPAPEIADALEALRFESDDDIGQHEEAFLVRTEDFVYMLSISTQEGAEPIDLDALAVELLAAYANA